MASCAQNEFAAARVIARGLPTDRGEKTGKNCKKTTPKVTFIGIFARQARLLSTMFRLLHQLACNSALSASRRMTKIASSLLPRSSGHRRSRSNEEIRMSLREWSRRWVQELDLRHRKAPARSASPTAQPK